MNETLGACIRRFLKELFGSRYLEHLENEIAILRQDHDRALHDRDILVAALREEKQHLMSKIAVYELSIMPRASRAGAEVVAYQKPSTPSKPKFDSFEMPPTKSRWQVVQEQHEEQMRKEIEEEAKKSQSLAAQG
jgi:hypothetical protein